jgi:hypothetical protein
MSCFLIANRRIEQRRSTFTLAWLLHCTEFKWVSVYETTPSFFKEVQR